MSRLFSAGHVWENNQSANRVDFFFNRREECSSFSSRFCSVRPLHLPHPTLSSLPHPLLFRCLHLPCLENDLGADCVCASGSRWSALSSRCDSLRRPAAVRTCRKQAERMRLALWQNARLKGLLAVYLCLIKRSGKKN